MNSFAPMETGSRITNTAVVSATGITPVTVSETILVEEAPILSITKSVSPVPVTENGTLTYTFLIQNMGNTAADATAGVVVLDTFSPILSNLSVTFNGAGWAEGAQYTYDETSGTFSSVAGRITVPAATYTRIRQVVHGWSAPVSALLSFPVSYKRLLLSAGISVTGIVLIGYAGFFIEKTGGMKLSRNTAELVNKAKDKE